MSLVSTILYHEQYKTGRAGLNTHESSSANATTISIPSYCVCVTEREDIGKTIQIRIGQRHEEISSTTQEGYGCTCNLPPIAKEMLMIGAMTITGFTYS